MQSDPPYAYGYADQQQQQRGHPPQQREPLAPSQTATLDQSSPVSRFLTCAVGVLLVLGPVLFILSLTSSFITGIAVCGPNEKPAQLCQYTSTSTGANSTVAGAGRRLALAEHARALRFVSGGRGVGGCSSQPWSCVPLNGSEPYLATTVLHGVVETNNVAMLAVGSAFLAFDIVLCCYVQTRSAHARAEARARSHPVHGAVMAFHVNDVQASVRRLPVVRVARVARPDGVPSAVVVDAVKA